MVTYQNLLQTPLYTETEKTLSREFGLEFSCSIFLLTFSVTIIIKETSTHFLRTKKCIFTSELLENETLLLCMHTVQQQISYLTQKS